MAKKREPNIEDAINIFFNAMQRASLSDYLHVNKTLLSKSPKGYSVLILIDQTLWNALLENEEFKNHLKEFNSFGSESEDNKIFSYGTNLTDAWIDLDIDSLYTGKVVKININGLEYDAEVHKNLIPLKLKKSEFNNIQYQVLTDSMTLILRKRFEYSLEDHGFTIIRAFQII